MVIYARKLKVGDKTPYGKIFRITRIYDEQAYTYELLVRFWFRKSRKFSFDELVEVNR